MSGTGDSGQPEFPEELSPQTDTKRGVQQKIECAAGQCVKTKEVLECGRLKEDVNCVLSPKAECQLEQPRKELESLDIQDAKDDLISSETPKSESSAEHRNRACWRRHRPCRNSSRKSNESPNGENTVEQPQDKDNVGTEKTAEAESASVQVQELVTLNIDGTGPFLEKFCVNRSPSYEAIATVAHLELNAGLNIHGAKPDLDQVFVQEAGQSAAGSVFDMHQDVVVPLVVGKAQLPKKRAANRDKTRRHKGVDTPQLEKQDFVDVLGTPQLEKQDFVDVLVTPQLEKQDFVDVLVTPQLEKQDFVDVLGTPQLEKQDFVDVLVTPQLEKQDFVDVLVTPQLEKQDFVDVLVTPQLEKQDFVDVLVTPQLEKQDFVDILGTPQLEKQDFVDVLVTPQLEKQDFVDVLVTPQLEKQDFVDVLGDGELLKKILEPGTRRSPKFGDRVVVNVQCEIPELEIVLKDERIEFVLGDGDVVQALELVVPLMKLKETCQVMAGHKYMYGEIGVEPAVPPYSNFKLTVKLLASKGPIDYIAMDMTTRFAEAKRKRDRGNFLVKRGEYSLALNSYSKANWILEQVPTLHKSGEVMEQCLELIAMINTCVTLYKLEEYAVMFGEKTIKSSYGRPYIRVGQALETAGDTEGAIDSYKQALRHDADKNKKLLYNHIDRLKRLCEKERACKEEDYKSIATI